METENAVNRENAQGKFKSYYVVWKPKRASAVPAPTTMFKSYYVVWKLRNKPEKRYKK